MKSKTSSRTEADLASKVRNAYLDYILTEGKNPTSVYQFAKTAGISEGDFYNHFSGFDGIGISIWKQLLDEVFSKLEQGPEWQTFGTQEKLLLFYFTVVQEFKNQRSYVEWCNRQWKNPLGDFPVRKFVNERLKQFFDERLEEGFQQNEIAQRKLVSKSYGSALILQFWMIVEFWLRDTSADFQDSDAFIEKSVQLGFSLMKESSLDKAVDLVRFMAGRVGFPQFQS